MKGKSEEYLSKSEDVMTKVEGQNVAVADWKMAGEAKNQGGQVTCGN